MLVWPGWLLESRPFFCRSGPLKPVHQIVFLQNPIYRAGADRDNIRVQHPITHPPVAVRLMRFRILDYRLLLVLSQPKISRQFAVMKIDLSVSTLPGVKLANI